MIEGKKTWIYQYNNILSMYSNQQTKHKNLQTSIFKKVSKLQWTKKISKKSLKYLNGLLS